jgi:hypothetical protein
MNRKILSAKEQDLIYDIFQSPTAYSVDAVVSWNFRDIVNIRTRRAVHSVNLRLGYPLIEIVSPEEVVEYEE